MRPHRSYLTYHSSWLVVQRTSPQRSKQRPLWSKYPCLRPEAELCCLQTSRMCSTSSKDAFKAEAPIGIYTERKAQLQMSFMQTSLGNSFRHLSRYINAYFTSKGQIALVPALQGCVTGMNKQVELENRGVSLKGTEFRAVKDFNSQPEQSHSTTSYSGLELFHNSSLVTKFGESYNYVASHINHVFFKSLNSQVSMEVPSFGDGFGSSKTSCRTVDKNHSTISKDDAAVDINNIDGSSSWEEGYLHFAHHINRYFGAKVVDNVNKSLEHQSIASGSSPPSYSMGHQQNSVASQNISALGSGSQDSHTDQPKPLFHMSNLSTHFGENFAYMATHINHYFQSSASTDEEIERNPHREQPEYRITLGKPLSYIQRIFNSSTIPSRVGGYFGMITNSSTTTVTSPEAVLDRMTVRRRLAEEKTRALLRKFKKAKTGSSISSCIAELNTHLILHPSCKTVMWQEKAAIQFLRYRRLFGIDEKLQADIRETLALIGYVNPLKGRGIRVLSIDGGGTRGVVPLQVLKQLEVQTGKQVYQLFDYVCGVSTGAILAFMLALARFSLEECEEMYMRFGSDVFSQNPFVGTVKMGWTHSYYNTETWEMILKEKIGDQLLIKTARDELCPKVSAVSAVVNWGTSPKPFIFRNYNHSPLHLSRYAGGSGYQLWQAVRASSAAPGYFQEFPLYNDIHQDGGIILNNPSALAVHESRLLWPNQPFQCVLSLGTGRYDTARRGPATSTSFIAKISNLISSATDTEGVHMLLADLLEPNVYFRFNPMLSAEVSLDESRPDALQKLQEDALSYLEQNKPKMDLLCSVLSEKRTTLWKTRDWISEKASELKQHWI